MGRFDGVALLALDDVESAPGDGSAPAPSRGDIVGDTLVTDDGRRFVSRCRPGVPGVLRDTRGRRIAVVGLLARSAGPAARSSGPAGVVHTGPRVTAILPPASTAGLLGCRPLAGGRHHAALFGHAQTLCGRLPVAGEPIDPGLVDCLRCLRSDVLTERFTQQLAHHDRLLALADPLTAAALAGWWPRLDHRDPGDLPVLLDAMVGARLHALPAARSTDEVLQHVRRHRDVASAAVRAWATDQVRPRLEQQLRRLLLDTGTTRETSIRREVALAGALLEAADVAETLVALLERHGPVASLEPLVLDIARRAGDAASDRVQRWRRIHTVAAALTPGRHPAPTRPTTHDRLHAIARVHVHDRTTTGAHR